MFVFAETALLLLISTTAFASKTLNSATDFFNVSHYLRFIGSPYSNITNVLPSTESTWKYGDSDRDKGSKFGCSVS